MTRTPAVMLTVAALLIGLLGLLVAFVLGSFFGLVLAS